MCIAPPPCALQEWKVSDVSVSVGRVEEEYDEEEEEVVVVVDVLRERAPPFPFSEVHEVKVDEVSVIDEVKLFNSITDPFPSFRLIFSIIPTLILLSLSDEERERKGEERRVKLDI